MSKCGFDMNKMTACHMICPNCGAHLDCSDKGNFGKILYILATLIVINGYHNRTEYRS